VFHGLIYNKRVSAIEQLSKFRSKAPFRLLYNDDNWNLFTVVSPWRERGEMFREDHLVSSIKQVAQGKADAYMLSPGNGWVPWWQSRVEPDFYRWWKKRTGLEITQIDTWGPYKYVAEGGDMVRVLVDTCKKLGMSPFVSFRLNDVHYLERYDEKSLYSLYCSRFYVEHPEYWIEPDHKKKRPTGYYHYRGMNWAIEDVRNYKLALITELIENYDLAGIELDFLRDNILFRRDETTLEQRIEIITDFVSKVRHALDRNTPAGKYRYLCVRIPLQLSAHGDIGLDVEQLYAAGVDMFNLSGWYHTIQRTDIKPIRKRVPDSSIYLEMTHSTASHRYFMPDKAYGTAGDPRTSTYQFYTTANLAYQQGADGMSLFNFFAYRGYGSKTLVPIIEPPFHVLEKLIDKDFLARQPQYYMLGKTAYYSQIPKTIKNNQNVSFQIDLALPENDNIDFKGRLRIHTEQALLPAHQIEVTMNGQSLEPTDDVSRILGNPFDEMISPHDHRRAWKVPLKILHHGANEISVSLTGYGIDVNVVYIDLGLE
jgi:hypothetical protein